MLKNIFIFFIFTLLIITYIIPGIAENNIRYNYKSRPFIVSNTFSQINNTKSDFSRILDWWTMFHHDLQHSGYSTSDAPNMNNTIWSCKTSDKVSSSIAVADNKVFFGSIDSKVYCLDTITGEQIWNYTTGGSIFSSPSVVDKKVFIGSYDKKVYCLDANTGNYIWCYSTF